MDDRAAALERAANRMRLVSDWADDLAHEIKNPLHAMVINLELVKRRAGTGEAGSVVERAEIVETELHRVHELVESLLRIVRPWPDQSVASVERVFATLLPAVRARARIRRLTFHHEDEAAGASVAMPPGDLAQAILNLVDNAIEATPEGGRVTTRAETTGDAIRITVTDTGAGVPTGGEDGAREDGAGGEGGGAAEGPQGLGLAVTGRLVRAAGGELRLDPAAEGQGTVATVTMPRAGSA